MNIDDLGCAGIVPTLVSGSHAAHGNQIKKQEIQATVFIRQGRQNGQVSGDSEAERANHACVHSPKN